MSEAMKVPLFPLNLVVFPGQTVPLHIFEERYKQMLQRCLQDRIQFGIVLARDGGRFGRSSPHSIGTLVTIADVNEIAEGQCSVSSPHRGSCFYISCRGDRRFRVTALNRREAEYLTAEVELYPDESAPTPALLMVAQRVASIFDDYYRQTVALSGGWQRETASGERTLMFDSAALQTSHGTNESGDPRTIMVPALPTDPTLLANTVAAELNVQPDLKQELLETPSALARLQREAEVLADEMPQMQERLKLQHRRRFGAFGMSN